MYRSFNEVSDGVEQIDFDPDSALEIARWAPLEESGVDEIVEDECVDTTPRWSDRYCIVIKDEEGRYWKSYYEQGSTEQQMQQPYEYKDTAEFTRVYKEPVVEFEFLTKDERDKLTPVETTVNATEEFLEEYNE